MPFIGIKLIDMILRRSISRKVTHHGKSIANHRQYAQHLVTSVIFTIVTVIALGSIYPLVMTGIAQLLPDQANGSLVTSTGKSVGSAIIGQLWTKPQYFQGRPSAAGKRLRSDLDRRPNLGPTSKKLIDATKATIAALKKANPDANGAVPMDLVTSSASGIDPDIRPEGAYYQAPRVAKARNIPVATVNALIARLVESRTFGFLGEPRVNVLELNLALDACIRRLRRGFRRSPSDARARAARARLHRANGARRSCVPASGAYDACHRSRSGFGSASARSARRRVAASSTLRSSIQSTLSTRRRALELH